MTSGKETKPLINQANVNNFPTLEKIISDCPPVEEIFQFKTDGKAGEQKGTISAKVSRDQEGRILYVVPGSAKLINCNQIDQAVINPAPFLRGVLTHAKKKRHPPTRQAAGF